MEINFKLFGIVRCRCPAHGNPGATSVREHGKTRSTAANVTTDKEYAFEVKLSCKEEEMIRNSL